MTEPNDTSTNTGRKRKHSAAIKWMRRVILLLFGLPIALLLLAVTALYVPGVLNLVAGKVLPELEKSTGMKIQVADIRLKFPMRLQVDDAIVITSATADTMLTARKASASVALMPLISGRIAVNSAEVTGAFYQMGAADSLYVGAKADTISVSDAMIAMSDGKIDVRSARLAGSRIKLLMGTGGTESTDTTPSQTDLTITVGDISLARVDYTMAMVTAPQSDSLRTDTIAASISSATLLDGMVAITPERVDIDCRSLKADIPSGLYGLAGTEPAPGLDLNWISVSETDFEVNKFTMRGTSLTVPVISFHTRERCGLTLDADGVFAMDSTSLKATDFRLLMPRSAIRLTAEMGLDSIPAEAPLLLDAEAEIGISDITTAMPMLSPMLSTLPDKVPMKLRANASGTMARLNIDTLTAAMQRVFSVSISGNAANLTAPADLVANLDLTGKLTDAGPIKKMVKGVNIPPLTLRGSASANRGAYAADLTARTSAGRLALKGTYSGTAPNYSANVKADSLPVGAFMPDLGIGAVTGTVAIKGRGFNPWSKHTALNASVALARAEYQRTILRDVNLKASLIDGAYEADLTSGTPAANLSLDASGTLSRRNLTWDLDGDIHELNLRELGLTDSVMQGSVKILSSGRLDPTGDSITAYAKLSGLDWLQGKAHLIADSITATLNGTPASVAATVSNRSLNIDMQADTSLTALMSSLSQVATIASSQVEKRNIHADSIHMALPTLRLHVNAGPDNLINDFLAPSDISFRSLNLNVANDSSLHAKAAMMTLSSGKSLRIDTIMASLAQRDSAMLVAMDLGNRPGTFDEFAHVGIRAGMEANVARAYIKQQNIKGATGYSLGLDATLADSLITVRFTPLDPVIAYKNWTFNEGNFVSFNPYTYHIDADLDASGAGSRVQLFTHHSHSETTDSVTSGNDALTLRISDVHIQDWLSINPFAPPISGDLSADMNFTYNQTSLNGNGNIGLTGLTYGKEKVGDFDLSVNLGTNMAGVVNADVALMVDSIKTITAVGALNDSTKSSPFLLDFSMIKMPLRIVNPFLPADMAKLSGTLNGTMEISGSMAKPRFDGYLNFDSAAVKVGMIGTGFTFSEAKVPVDSNVVKFRNFAITGANKNSLLINGSVDMASLSDPHIDLNLNARDMMVVNSKKRKGVDVYGKAYIDLDASVRGNLRFMSVDASLSLLPKTDVTYILSTSESQIGLQNTSEMVKFVNFRDTAAVVLADSVVQTSMQMMLNARLNVEQGSTITVDLSADGKNRAQIKGDGILNYTQTPLSSDGRLTGRFTINDGYVKYSLPVISEKNFSFTPGSYVTWTGAMLNPTLSVSAVDQVRANVTQEGANSRLVNFDVTISATGTLEHMNVAFDLNTIDDISVQNELRSMSAQQRANQAMNLLLYNMYSGPNTTGNANLSGNALYGFLTSQINTWAANTIKGVDVSFGMDQYNSTRDGSTSTATQYSYKVSKSLFNNRFKIVVGGNYSTDASEDENLAQNLISDISFEYMLNESGSMYVRLFRHTGYESILEGEITQTGVGFVLKRKIHRLSDLFRLRRRSVQLPKPVETPINDNATVNQ